MNGLKRIEDCIAEAQYRFAETLASYLKNKSTNKEHYHRYLSFQYHLTKNVQKYFMAIASHQDLSRRRPLREFLYKFANEEELHYIVAANDLYSMGLKPLDMPIDVTLWHAYFQGIVSDRPFVRLGAATILENISSGVAKEWVDRALQGDFLGRHNTKFLVLHKHEALPHGEQILAALGAANLEERHLDDLVEGARIGTVMYLRMAEWALFPTTLSSLCDCGEAKIEDFEMRRIKEFNMSELN
jgi:hypothetical protein